MAPGADTAWVAAILRRAACPTAKQAARERPGKKLGFAHITNHYRAGHAPRVQHA